MIHGRSAAKSEWCKQRDEIGRDAMSSRLQSRSQASPYMGPPARLRPREILPQRKKNPQKALF